LLIHSFLPPHSLALLQRAFPTPHVVSNANSWEALLSHITRRHGDVAVVDPSAGAEGEANRRVEMLALANPAAAGISIVGYVSVTAASLRAVHGLAKLGASEIVIAGVDDSASELAATVHRAIASCGTTRVFSELGPSVHALTAEIAAALESMFRHPERFHSVGELATAARTTRRSLDRALARAGLASARTLLRCARANAAFHLIAGGRVRKAKAAVLLGYASTRSLTRDFQAVTGSRSALPDSLSRDAFSQVLHHRLLRESIHAAAGSY
jgi:AraC-like DNA-binding protein